MKKIFLFSLFLLWGISVNAAPLITVVAVVNNDAVTSHQLEKKLAATMAANTKQHQLTKEQHQTLRLKVLNGMIEDLLVEQRIRELGLTVSEQQLNSAIEDVQRQNKLTRVQLKTALQAQGMPFSTYTKSLRKQILRYKLIGREVNSKVEVTHTQISAYFKAHADEYKTPPTLQLARISYPIAKDAVAQDKDRIMQQAQVARQQLLSGKSFAAVFKAQEGVEGGEMGVVAEKELNPQLRQLVAGLKTGQVSEPKEVLGGIHILQVVARTRAKAKLSAKISTAIEKILAKQNSEKLFAVWKKGLRKDAVVDIRL